MDKKFTLSTTTTVKADASRVPTMYRIDFTSDGVMPESLKIPYGTPSVSLNTKATFTPGSYTAIAGLYDQDSGLMGESHEAAFVIPPALVEVAGVSGIVVEDA